MHRIGWARESAVAAAVAHRSAVAAAEQTKQTVTALETELAGTRRQSESLTAKAVGSLRALAAAKAKVGALETELEHLGVAHAKIDALEARAVAHGEDAAAQRGELESALATAQAELDRTQSELVGERRQSVALQGQSVQSLAVLAAAHQKVGALERELEQLGVARARIDALEARAAAHGEATVAERTELQGALAAAQADQRVHAEALSAERRQSVALEGHAEQLRAAHSAVEERERALASKLAVAKSVVAAQRVGDAEQRAALGAAQAEAREAALALQRKERQLQEQLAYVASVSSQRDDAHVQLGALQEQLTSTRREGAAFEVDASARAREAAELREALRSKQVRVRLFLFCVLFFAPSSRAVLYSRVVSKQMTTLF